MWRIVFEVVAAMLAVWGLYCALRALGELFFVPRAYAVAVHLREGETAASLSSRIIEARLALSGSAEQRVLLLCDAGKCWDEEVEAILREHTGEVLTVVPRDGQKEE
ncbi:MAG: hypothetical protein E7654_06695 [Ruminococcaceae bacterium]|nr:hypothetical protein [Oscillospiraceae bacterium]